MNDKLNETVSVNDEGQLNEAELELAAGGIIWGLVAGIVIWNALMVEKDAH
jgi:hypothetical protein